MSEDTVVLREAIKKRWGKAGNPKVQRYVGKFWNRQRRQRKITAVVKGNHGNYTVSVEVQEATVWSTCSCYIGKNGYCHHCAALGLTFLAQPDSFVVIEMVAKTAVSNPNTLKAYLDSITLDDLTKQMRAKGITQKAFCESIGMNPRHLTVVKSSERRNRHFNELGAMKLAVLWVLDNLD